MVASPPPLANERLAQMIADYRNGSPDPMLEELIEELANRVLLLEQQIATLRYSQRGRMVDPLPRETLLS